MGIDYQAIADAGGLGKGESRHAEKQRRRAEEAAQMRAVYRLVDLRDGMRCRVTGVYVDTQALDPLKRGHHHHIQFRSRGGLDTTANVCLVSGEIHRAIHDGKLRLEGDADQRDPEGRLCGLAVLEAREQGWLVTKWV